MGPLAATALVALAGVAPAGPVVVHTARVDDPGAESVVANFADSRPLVTLQWDALGDAPPRGQHGVRFDPADDAFADNSPVQPFAWESRGLLLTMAVEPVGPFSGNPAIEPRPAAAPRPREP